jgi:hypothetical protein
VSDSKQKTRKRLRVAMERKAAEKRRKLERRREIETLRARLAAMSPLERLSAVIYAKYNAPWTDACPVVDSL